VDDEEVPPVVVVVRREVENDGDEQRDVCDCVPNGGGGEQGCGVGYRWGD
jgi:hypothetical protein